MIFTCNAFYVIINPRKEREKSVTLVIFYKPLCIHLALFSIAACQRAQGIQLRPQQHKAGMILQRGVWELISRKLIFICWASFTIAGTQGLIDTISSSLLIVGIECRNCWILKCMRTSVMVNLFLSKASVPKLYKNLSKYILLISYVGSTINKEYFDGQMLPSGHRH